MTPSLPPHLRLGETRHGPTLHLAGDVYIGRSLEKYGECCQLEVELLSRLAPEGGLVVEAGANIGVHTVPLARRVGAHGSVIAFEPQRVVFQLLCANLALGGVMNVDARQTGLGAAAGEARVPPLDYTRPNNYGGVPLGGDAGETVPVMALDQLSLHRLDLLKIDVEGMEPETLRGAGSQIARHRPVIYIENDRPAHAHALTETLLGLGYRLWRHFPPLFNPGNWRGDRENVFGGLVSLNVLCLPRETADGAGATEGLEEITSGDRYMAMIDFPKPGDRR